MLENIKNKNVIFTGSFSLFIRGLVNSYNDIDIEVISENEIDESKLKKAISDTGYSVTSFKAEPYEKKKGLFSFFSK